MHNYKGQPGRKRTQKPPSNGFTLGDGPLAGEEYASLEISNSYVYVGNNPLAYTDPTGMELVQLGQHTDEEIKRRQAEIKQQRKDLKNDKSISKDERKAQDRALKAESKTLGLEMEGNRVGNALLTIHCDLSIQMGTTQTTNSRGGKARMVVLHQASPLRDLLCRRRP